MTSESSQLSLAQLNLASNSNSAQSHSWRIGPRLCLNEPCERNFQPTHHLDRYCSPECLESARRWQVRFANQVYRRSNSGKLRRKEQAQRYRLNLKERKAREAALAQKTSELEPLLEPLLEPQLEPQLEPLSVASREGYTKESSHEKSCCHRPGCYRRFTPPPQSPLKKFCSPRCRNALRRVILRERKWVARLKSIAGRARDGPRGKAS